MVWNCHVDLTFHDIADDVNVLFRRERESPSRLHFLQNDQIVLGQQVHLRQFVPQIPVVPDQGFDLREQRVGIIKLKFYVAVHDYLSLAGGSPGVGGSTAESPPDGLSVCSSPISNSLKDPSSLQT